MKKNLVNNLILIFILLFMLMLFFYSNDFNKLIINGCYVFFYKVFPNLLPMFIIQDLLINYNFFSLIEKIFYPIFHKIFKMNKMAVYVFIMSFFVGTPTNAYIVSNLVKKEVLNKNDARVILNYSCFLNPLFVYNTFLGIFNDCFLSIKLMLIPYLINIVMAFLYRNYPYNECLELKEENSLKFIEILKQSIKKSLDTLMIILGIIIFYFMISGLINIFIKNDLINCLVHGLLETTGGLSKISSLKVSLIIKKILAVSFISFGGISIYTQIKTITDSSKIVLNNFFIIRVIEAIVSILIVLVI